MLQYIAIIRMIICAKVKTLRGGGGVTFQPPCKMKIRRKINLDGYIPQCLGKVKTVLNKDLSKVKKRKTYIKHVSKSHDLWNTQWPKNILEWQSLCTTQYWIDSQPFAITPDFLSSTGIQYLFCFFSTD